MVGFWQARDTPPEHQAFFMFKHHGQFVKVPMAGGAVLVFNGRELHGEEEQKTPPSYEELKEKVIKHFLRERSMYQTKQSGETCAWRPQAQGRMHLRLLTLS